MTIALSPITTRQTERAERLLALGARPNTVAELLAYTNSAFDTQASANTRAIAPSLHVEAWAAYASEARQIGAFAALRNHLAQLRFPIAHGMSDKPDYIAATRRGELPAGDAGLELRNPNGVRLFIHRSLAGDVPVVIVEQRADFEALVRALAHRNEPAEIPASMGACIVDGYNNWDRIHALKRAWLSDHASATEQGWLAEFMLNVVPHRALYQDTFIVLSSGPYSGVSHEAMNLSAETWDALSLTIRLEHECAHYFTLRRFGSMRNNLLDELIADYHGITCARGEYSAEWFLRFMGLERWPAYRSGARLENYRGTPPLSDDAFALLQSLVKRAAENVERFDRAHRRALASDDGRAAMLSALSSTTLDALASDDAILALESAWDAHLRRNSTASPVRKITQLEVHES